MAKKKLAPLEFKKGNMQMNGRFRRVAEDRKYTYKIIPVRGGKHELEVRTKTRKIPRTAAYETTLKGAMKIAELWHQGKIFYKGNNIYSSEYYTL